MKLTKSLMKGKRKTQNMSRFADNEEEPDQVFDVPSDEEEVDDEEQVAAPVAKGMTLEGMCEAIRGVLESNAGKRLKLLAQPKGTKGHKNKLQQLREAVERKKRVQDRMQFEQTAHELPVATPGISRLNEEADPREKELEIRLMGVATQSVVQLLTQIKQYQRMTGTDESQAAKTRRTRVDPRRANMVQKNASKESGVLFSSKTGKGTKTKRKSECDGEDASKPKKWNVVSEEYTPFAF